jgi:hypothetical protein
VSADTTRLIPESLDGTRTSHRWAELPGNWDTVNARAVWPSSNEHGIPDLPAARGEPARLVSYADRRACDTAREGDAIHFFLDDYRFETLWTKPERPLPRLQRVGTALTPDFSLWAGMPAAVQLWQVYRARWCGLWMIQHGISVIPAVSWSTADSYRYCFAGIAPGSVVAVSTVGVLRDPEAAGLFAAGIDAMLQAVRPSRILCYGAWPWSAIRAPALADMVTEYPTRWDR